MNINGDGIRGAGNRLRYLWNNFVHNLRGSSNLRVERRALSAALQDQNVIQPWSPGRGLTEYFVRQDLPDLLKQRQIPERDLHILDIGCGSGRSAELFADAGLAGKWSGTDIDDRYVERSDLAQFQRNFVQGDILTWNPQDRFDLVYSNSALEHIPQDPDYPGKIRSWLSPNGMQLHFVPAPASLFLYLWHGWRQYSLAHIEEEFGQDGVTVYALGGFATSLLHFLFITPWENLLRLSPRKRFSGFYCRCLYYALKADKYVPFWPGFYAIIVDAKQNDTKG